MLGNGKGTLSSAIIPVLLLFSRLRGSPRKCVGVSLMRMRKKEQKSWRELY